jgi:hypothetical protein
MKSSLMSSVSFFDARIVTFLRSCATALPQLSFCLGFLARMESDRAASTEAPAGMDSLSKGDAQIEVRDAARARSTEMDLMLPSGAQVLSGGLLNYPEYARSSYSPASTQSSALTLLAVLGSPNEDALILPPPRAFFALSGRSFPRSIGECGVPTH